MRTRAVRPRWTWLFMRSTACWSWDARAMSASPEPGRGWGHCVHTPDRCTTLSPALGVLQGEQAGERQREPVLAHDQGDLPLLRPDLPALGPQPPGLLNPQPAV